MTTPAARVKGQTLTSMLLFAQRELSPAQYEQLMATLTPDERKDIAHVLPPSTYPVSLVNRLTVDGARISGRSLSDFARQAGRFNAQEGVKGVYRFIARILSPEALLSRATSLWSTMNLAGTMTMEKDGPKGGVIWLNDYPEPTEAMCLRVSGWMEQLLELAGSKGPVVRHPRCRALGATVCEWRVTW
jgi:hypothetical protein